MCPLQTVKYCTRHIYSRLRNISKHFPGLFQIQLTIQSTFQSGTFSPNEWSRNTDPEFWKLSFVRGWWFWTTVAGTMNPTLWCRAWHRLIVQLSSNHVIIARLPDPLGAGSFWVHHDNPMTSRLNHNLIHLDSINTAHRLSIHPTYRLTLLLV